MILTNTNNAPTLTPSCDDISMLLDKFRAFKGNDTLNDHDLITFMLSPTAERAEFYFTLEKTVTMISNRVMVQKIT